MTEKENRVYRDGDVVVEAVQEATGPLTEQDQKYVKGMAVRPALQALTRAALGGHTVAQMREDWMPQDGNDQMRKHMAGDTVVDMPTILPVVGMDGLGLWYPGKVNMLSAAAGVGKTWMALLTTLSVLNSGGRVVYLDMEDTWASWRNRAEMLGADLHGYVERDQLLWMGPDTLPKDADLARDLVAYWGQYDLLVVDVMNRLVQRLGGSVNNSNDDTGWAYDHLLNPVTQSERNTAVLLLDHPTVRGQSTLENPNARPKPEHFWPGGGALKRNNLDGHALGMRAVERMTKDNPKAYAELYTLKDRHGTYMPTDMLPNAVWVADGTDLDTPMKMKVVVQDHDKALAEVEQQAYAAGVNAALQAVVSPDGTAHWLPWDTLVKRVAKNHGMLTEDEASHVVKYLVAAKMLVRDKSGRYGATDAGRARALSATETHEMPLHVREMLDTLLNPRDAE